MTSATANDYLAAEPPLLRGMLHLVGFVAACSLGTVLVSFVDGRRLVAAAIFATAAATMLGLSALYHRGAWSIRTRLWLRRLDHAGIYLLIAGTYAPVGLLSLHGTMQRVVLAVVWSAAAAAILTKVCWVRSPHWLTAAFGLAIGWVGVAAMPQVAASAGAAAVVLLAAGGLAYTAGALVYVRRKPDPLPAVFGYHEVFHALTLVALACQYVAIAFFVVRVG